MDPLDRKLLNRLQSDFPLDTRPFARIAQELGMEEADVLARVRRLCDSGIIRRLGPIIDIRKAGGATTLAAAQVPPERLQDVGRRVSACDGVSHNYHREGRNAPLPFNLWFTVSARDEAELAQRIESMTQTLGVTVHALPMLRQFKIGVRYKLDE